jgi:hypothetical protein
MVLAVIPLFRYLFLTFVTTQEARATSVSERQHPFDL